MSIGEVTHPVRLSEGMAVISPAPRDLWEATISSDPNALVSNTPAWTDCICRLGGYEDASRLYELPHGRRAVLPMVRRLLPGPLASEASRPFNWDAGGLVAAGGVTTEDVALVLRDLAGRGVMRTALRPGPLDVQSWEPASAVSSAVIPRLAHVLELDRDFERVWCERFTSTARRHVRRAERSGLRIERDTSGRLVPVVYELFERSIDRWARKQHEPRPLARWRGHRRDPVQKFDVIAKTLGEACRIWLAWHDGQPAAAIMVLQGGDASYIRGMMNEDLAGPTRANYLLHTLAIEEACEAGCRFYNMGETGSSASLAQFKTRFGARPYPYAEYFIERLPLTELGCRARSLVKQAIRFRD